MRFGLVIMNDYPPGVVPAERLPLAIEQVEAAERAGFDSIWVLQHYLGNMPTLQPWPLLGRFSAVSGEMTIGTNIFVLPLVHPVEAAENFATLDHLSGGRVVAGLGMGYRENEFDSFGIELSDRIGRYTESVQILRSLWSGAPTTFSGEHFEIAGQTISVPPVNPDGIPLWVGAGPHTKGARRAAQLGDAWIVPPHVSPDEVERLYGIYREELERLGKPLERDYVIRREIFLDPDPERARALGTGSRVEVSRKYAEFNTPDSTASYRHLRSDKVDEGAKKVAEDSYFFTDPAGCVAELRRLEAIGVNYVVARMQWFHLEQEETLRSLELFRDEVMPHFR